MKFTKPWLRDNTKQTKCQKTEGSCPPFFIVSEKNYQSLSEQRFLFEVKRIIFRRSDIIYSIFFLATIIYSVI